MAKLKHSKPKYAYYGPQEKSPQEKRKIIPATKKQKDYMSYLGIQFSEGISISLAKDLIQNHLSKSRKQTINFYLELKRKGLR